ncbi:MAG: acetyl-CoA acetyltransferase [Acidimicrobiales bacterium]
MAVNAKSAVVVGVGQFQQKPANPAEALEPLAMMVAAIERAAEDAGARSLLARAESIRVVQGAWPYRDPGRLIAARLGADLRDSVVTPNGGNAPQALVNDTALAIERGELSVAILTGAEGINSRRRARAAGVTIPYTTDADAPRARRLGPEVEMSHPVEVERGIDAPVNFYPMFETAIRYANGEDVDAHRARIARLWAGFNAVAVQNPNAWIRTPLTAEQIAAPGPDNRMIGFPYTKLLNSNWNLDQAAAVIMCSAEAAEALGIARDRWVFPQAGTDGHDTYFVSNRRDLHSSPAIKACGEALFELAGCGVDDVAHVDLYSCFPSAVQIGAAELGLGLDRPLTVTGGLTFAGGPLNNYVLHAIATMVEVLRAHPGELGLNSANGGYTTKHALGLYSTEPPAGGFKHADVQAVIEKTPARELDAGYAGRAELESYTVMFDGDNRPAKALAACLTPAGARQWATSEEPGLLGALCAEEHCGRAVELDAKAQLHLV